MSAYTTLYVTELAARKYLINRVMSMSIASLERLIDNDLQNALAEVRITDYGTDDETLEKLL